MTKYNIDELPPICHHMQIIILGSMIEEYHSKVVNQPIDPSVAREHAVQYRMADQNQLQPAFKRMVIEAFQTSIRIWRAMDDLGLKWDKRPIRFEQLVFMGLDRGEQKSIINH